MAKQILSAVTVTFGTGATDITSFVRQVSLNTTAAEIPTTNMGSAGAVTRIQGLIDSSITLDLYQDYPTIEKLFFDAFTNGTAVAMTIKPGTAAAGSANPSYAFSVLPVSWNPINGAVGEVATVQITYPISGVITKSGTGA